MYSIDSNLLLLLLLSSLPVVLPLIEHSKRRRTRKVVPVLRRTAPTSTACRWQSQSDTPSTGPRGAVSYRGNERWDSY